MPTISPPSAITDARTLNDIHTDFWLNRRVFLTGDTGFIGGWLALALADLGAYVYGYALPPSGTEPTLYQIADIETALSSVTRADIRNQDALQKALDDAQPEIVFHLAAQSLVPRARLEPLETFSVNVIGTVTLLESLRLAKSSLAKIIIVTSDKVYDPTAHDNSEETLSDIRPHAYVESDPLGGREPYAASKAAQDLAARAYAESYFSPRKIALATARAGNVIGGGDFSANRLIPDAIRAFMTGDPLLLRSPLSRRPWQYIGDLIIGLLLLAEHREDHFSAWNLGPRPELSVSVMTVAKHLTTAWGEGACFLCDPQKYKQLTKGESILEESILTLDTDRARSVLGWTPCYDLTTMITETLHWYRLWTNHQDNDMPSLSRHILSTWLGCLSTS